MYANYNYKGIQVGYATDNVCNGTSKVETFQLTDLTIRASHDYTSFDKSLTLEGLLKSSTPEALIALLSKNFLAGKPFVRPCMSKSSPTY